MTKFKLDKLKVRSFITELDKSQLETAKGKGTVDYTLEPAVGCNIGGTPDYQSTRVGCDPK